MNKILALLVAGSLMGCTSLELDPSNLSFGSNSLEKISQENKEQIANIVNSRTKSYGVGSTKISPSGTFILEEEARKRAYNDLENKVEDQVENFFSQHMLAIDGYTKKIYSLALNDLEKYAVAKAMEGAEEGKSFIDNGRKYVILTLENQEIFDATKTTFENYNQDLVSKLSASKEKVKNSTYIQLGEELPPVEEAVTEGGKEEKTYDLPLD